MRIQWPCYVVWLVQCLRSTTQDLNVNDPEQRKRSAHRLIAKLPTIAAMAYKYTVGQAFCLST